MTSPILAKVLIVLYLFFFFIPLGGASGYPTCFLRSVREPNEVLTCNYIFNKSCNMKLIIMIFLSLCISVEAFAQDPQWGWVKQVGSKANGESINFIRTDTKGNLIAVENCLDSTEVESHIVSVKIAKYDPSGNLLWKSPIRQKKQLAGFNIAFDISSQSLEIDSNDNIFYLANLSDSAYVFEKNLDSNSSYLLKFSPTGSLIWKSQFSTTSQGKMAIDIN